MALMENCIRDPRRSPRVRLQAQARVDVRGTVRRGVTADIGAGGCLLVPDEPIVRGTVVRIVLVEPSIPEPPAFQGRVAWARNEQAGIEFGLQSSAEAAAWIGRFVEAQPELHAALNAVPSELALDAALFASRPPPDVRLSPDESSMLRSLAHGMAAGILVSRSGLTAPRAARAIFGLLEKGMLSLDPCGTGEPPKRSTEVAPVVEPHVPVDAPVVELSSLMAPSADSLLRGDAAKNRPATAQALLDGARDAARKGRFSTAIAFARAALKHAPRDREIATALAQFVCRRSAATL